MVQHFMKCDLSIRLQIPSIIPTFPMWILERESGWPAFRGFTSNFVMQCTIKWLQSFFECNVPTNGVLPTRLWFLSM